MAKSDVGVDWDYLGNNMLNLGSLNYATSSILTPPLLVASQNNYNPVGYGQEVSVLRLSAAGAVSITGLIAPPTAKTVIFFNAGAANNITITDNSASSLANNRFLMNGNVLLNPNEGFIFLYDLNSLRWRATEEQYNMKKLWLENISNYPAVSWSENAPNNDFTDVSNDLVAWDTYGKRVLDLDRYRYEMKNVFYFFSGTQLENFASLSAEIKYIGAKYFFIPYALRLMVTTEEQDYDNWEWLVVETQGTPTLTYKGRARTFDEMRKCVSHRVRKELMSMSDSQQMLKDVGQMADWFIRANSPDFKQWITNEVGSPYENNGFLQATYYNQTLKDELYSIYNGNY